MKKPTVTAAMDRLISSFPNIRVISLTKAQMAEYKKHIKNTATWNIENTETSYKGVELREYREY